ELKMTIGIILLGSLLFLLYRYWKGIYRLFPEEFSLDALYNHTLSGLEKGSSKVTKGYMTGYLRDYLVYIYLFFVTAIGGVLIRSEEHTSELQSRFDLVCCLLLE